MHGSHKILRVLVRGWPLYIFVLLIAISLRYVLALPGTIGQSWDWEVSAFASQIWAHLSHDFYAWDYQLRGGFYAPFKPAGWYSVLALPLSIFGGEVFSKAFIAGLMLLAGISMRQFATGVLKLNGWWSTTAGALYMLSPVVYSRIMAGHNLLLPYALLPLLLLYTFRTMQGCAVKGHVPWRNAVAAGLLLGLQAIHTSLMILAGVLVGLVILLAFLKSPHRRAVVASAGVMAALFALLNIYWALPMAAGYLSSGTLYHSGSSLDSPSAVTATSVVSQRQNLFDIATQPLQEALRQHAFVGYHTEFSYPVPNQLASLWVVVSFLLPLAAFAVLLFRNEPDDAYLTLAISGLLGVTLVSGASVLTGQVIYQWLMTHAFPIWAEFGNTVRALPLVTLAYSGLVPAFAQRATGRLKLTAQVAAAAPIVLVLLIYVSPFLAGWTLVDPKDPLALKAYQPSSADQKVYNFLRNDSGDYRVTYVPPPWTFYPELYDLGYQWMGGESPHPEFFLPYQNPEAWRSASDFRSDIHDSLSGKLLGLGAVKYVIYPRGRFVNPSLGLSPAPLPQVAGPSDLGGADNTANARFVDQVLQTQRDLVPVSGPFTPTILLRNDAYLPRIYAAPQATIVHGDSNLLSTIADSSFFDRQPAIFFDAQQASASLKQLENLANRVIEVLPGSGSSRSDNPGTPASYLVTAAPLSSPNASFYISHDRAYTIRVQAFRFQSSPDRPEDVTRATFERIQADEGAGWSSNTPFNYNLSPDAKSLQVVAYLDKPSVTDQYVLMEQTVEPLSLADYPELRITSQVENPSAQAIAVQLSLDLNDDGVADATWTSPVLAHTNLRNDGWNAFDMVRAEFPNQAHYRVVGVAVRFEKKPLESWERVDYAAGLYTFGLQDVGLYTQSSAPGWAWQRPELAPRQETTLVRSLTGLDVQRFPVLLDYHVDGPATLYANAQLITVNAQGAQKAIPAGSWRFDPYSNGTLTLDVREQLLGATVESGWTATRVELTVQRLRARPELRSTTLSLGPAGARWLADALNKIDLPPPALMLDGKPIALKEIPTDADHLRYQAQDVFLPAGKHSVAAAYSDPASPYSVESIEIEPADSHPAASPPNLTFESINPTRFRVHVTNAQAPYFLVFSETFDPGWSARTAEATDARPKGLDPSHWYAQSSLLSAVLEGGGTQISDHYLANGYANGWYVDKMGTYDIIVEFMPQRLYEAGWIVSSITFAGIVVLLAWRRKGRSS